MKILFITFVNILLYFFKQMGMEKVGDKFKLIVNASTNQKTLLGVVFVY